MNTSRNNTCQQIITIYAIILAHEKKGNLIRIRIRIAKNLIQFIHATLQINRRIEKLNKKLIKNPLHEFKEI